MTPQDQIARLLTRDPDIFTENIPKEKIVRAARSLEISAKKLNGVLNEGKRRFVGEAIDKRSVAKAAAILGISTAALMSALPRTR